MRFYHLLIVLDRFQHPFCGVADQMDMGEGAHHQRTDIVLMHETLDDVLCKTVQQMGLRSIDGVLGDQSVAGFALLAAAPSHVVFICLRYLGVEQ